MIRAYLRVSTTKQAEAGGVESQRAAIERWADGREVVWYCDNGCSGATMDREAWQELLDDAERGDTIAVYDLSRISRDSLDIIQWARAMHNRGISVAFVGQGFGLEAGPIGNLILNVWASVVQFERDMLSQKTREGMKATKSKIGRGALRVVEGQTFNINTGEPSKGKRVTSPELIARARQIKQETGKPWKDVAKELGVSTRTLEWGRKRYPG